MKEDVIKSFNKIALLDDKWDHNQNYAQLLLKEIGDGLENALDIGCGTGEFTRKLSEKVDKVIGIDISPKMIEEAKQRHPHENIKYLLKDFDELDETIIYDCIVSIATFHHLNLDTALPKIKRLLKNNGVLVVLDLYERKGIIDLLLDIAAVPSSFILKRIKNGSRKDNYEEIQAWNEHSKLDKYMDFNTLKQVYCRYLKSGVEIKRLLYWRYVVVYRKSAE